MKDKSVRLVSNNFQAIMRSRKAPSNEGIELADYFKVGVAYQTDYHPVFNVILDELFTLACKPQYKNAISYPSPTSCIKKAIQHVLLGLDNVSYNSNIQGTISECVDTIVRMQENPPIQDDPDGFAAGSITTFRIRLEDFLSMYENDELS